MVPITTLSIMGVCMLVYSWQFIADPDLNNYALEPRSVLYLNEYYRFVTASLCHVNFMHITMNMMTFLGLGSSLEKKFGSLWHLITILWSILLTCTINVLIAYMTYLLLGMDNLMSSRSAGFSGVLFHLTVIEANISPHLSRQVYGMFHVSSAAYPWVLLVVIQVLLPHVSFMGHLAGILCGSLHIYGLLDCIFPSEDYFRSIEEGQLLRPVYTLPGYIKTPSHSNNSIFSQTQHDPSAIRQSIGRFFKIIFKFIRDVCETIKVILFGRGNSENSNIRFTSGETNALGIRLGSAADDLDEDEWVGLPPMPESSSSPESRLL